MVYLLLATQVCNHQLIIDLKSSKDREIERVASSKRDFADLSNNPNRVNQYPNRHD